MAQQPPWAAFSSTIRLGSTLNLVLMWAQWEQCLDLEGFEQPLQCLNFISREYTLG